MQVPSVLRRGSVASTRSRQTDDAGGDGGVLEALVSPPLAARPLQHLRMYRVCAPTVYRCAETLTPLSDVLCVEMLSSRIQPYFPKSHSFT